MNEDRGDGISGLRLCLAASGGGHLRQLLDLEPVWRNCASYLVTEPTALGHSLSGRLPTDFVAHYSFGQARHGHPLRMLGGAMRNLRQSWASVRGRRPQVVVTTGAGAVFWTVALARLFGSRVILIESFARFRGPSLFGRLVRFLAHDVVVQSAALRDVWPDAQLFDPLRMLDRARPRKDPLVFVTVGATLPFDRMVQAALDAKRSGAIADRMVLQVGSGSAIVDPGLPDVELVEALPFDAIGALLERADVVVTHGGTGSIVTALREGCHVVAFPRLYARREHYDDHQEEIVSAFAERGLLARVDDGADLPAALASVRGRPAPMATTDPQALQRWLGGVLAAEAERRGEARRSGNR